MEALFPGIEMNFGFVRMQMCGRAGFINKGVQIYEIYRDTIPWITKDTPRDESGPNAKRRFLS